MEIVEQAGGAKVRRHFRGLAEDDGQPFAIVFANCAAPGGETTADGSYSVLSEPGNPDFTWVVTGEAGVVDSGSGSLNEDDGGFTIENLTLGDFTLAITEEGLEPSGATTIFSVLGCVTTTVSCRAVTYTNPVGNPGVAVLYGRPTSSGFPDIDGALVDLSPGGSQTVRTARPATSWIGIALGDLEDDDEDDYNISLAGLVDSLAVPQDCDRPLSTLSVSCVDNHPRLTVTLAREGSNQPVELTVRNRKGKVVASGEPENDRSTVTLRLPGPGRYTYRSYFEGALAYETLPVEIDSCGVAAPAGNTLADTGPPPLLPLWFGSALLAAGAALLTRRTRPARRAAPHRRPPARGR